MNERRCDDPNCATPRANLYCDCRRCRSEPTDDEKFWACVMCVADATAKHQRIRGRPAEWLAVLSADMEDTREENRH